MSSVNESVMELAFLATKITSPGDRVRITEWIRKLVQTHTEENTHPKLVEEYLDYLKLILTSTPIYLVDPFKSYPPKNKPLVPLAEALGNSISKKCPFLPQCGSPAPVVLHRSGDDTATITVNRDPDGEVYCYMAIAPRDP
ncbi:uncharacterized protein LOC131678242 [Topomyia yanbarensis]|uniref:uncharacterized protein LOC131678242 n=1 Tax=Topomyia yanbarensis TaxID=2498891 RepID=UPI00273C5BCD|nr:uncharacterized protein LOC131678242 [Topomyia yanbarensis]